MIVQIMGDEYHNPMQLLGYSIIIMIYIYLFQYTLTNQYGITKWKDMFFLYQWPYMGI